MDKKAQAHNKSIRKSWADGSTIGSMSSINFSSGRHSNNQHQLLTSIK